MRMSEALVGAACAAAALTAGAATALAQTTTPTAPTSAQGESAPQTPRTTSPESPPAPVAAPAPDFTLAFNFGAATDYVFRGVSQTKQRTQGFVGVDATYKQFYAGAWTSNVDFRPFGDHSTTEEVDVYAGWRPTVATVSLDLGVQYYAYLNQPNYLPAVDYTEIYLKGTKAYGAFTVGASLYYSPEFTGKTGNAEYYEGNLAYAYDKKWTISGAVGRQEIEKATSYTTWNLGATYAITDHVGLDLRYWDTDEHSIANEYGSRGVVSLKSTF